MAAEMSADQKSEPATLEVGGEEVKMEMPETREVDMHDRDPNHMNDHVKVRFQDLIGEPDTEVFSFDRVWELSYKLRFEDLIGEPDNEIYSLDKVWELSQTVFGGTRLWCYRITSVICALPVALCWGIYFACLSFCSIWCCIPCLKACDIECFCFRKCYEAVINACIAPWFEAVGLCLKNINIKLHKAFDA